MKILIYISLLAIFFSNCEKIIAEDIQNQMPSFIIPALNDTITQNPVHFKWNEMKGAEAYHLMVVSPSFSAITQYPLDTIVTSTDFFFALDSNEYEVRMAAVNAGYTSDTIAPVKFWVGVQPSNSGGVSLLAPSDSLFINSSFTNQFQWNSLTDALSYEFSLRQGNSFATGVIIEGQNNISTTIYTASATLTEGEYHWGVFANLLSGGSTVVSARTLFIDQTSPNIAALSVPVDLSFLSPGSITFSWNNGTDPGTINSPINSFIEISTDIAFTTISNSATLQGNTTSFSLIAGTYYWRVTNTDVAGNNSASSTSFQLTIL